MAGVVRSVVGVLFVMARQDLFNFTGRPTTGEFCVRYRLNKPRPLPHPAVWVSAWQLCWALEKRKGWMADGGPEREGRGGQREESGLSLAVFTSGFISLPGFVRRFTAARCILCPFSVTGTRSIVSENEKISVCDRCFLTQRVREGVLSKGNTCSV